ncbi:succinate dehydrogenase / fumarate reductase membrane anchor subunit [Sinobacterium caligoides]|uniref:Succinate dehydrogenase hydrophobic membrane anchor subunit n=1 Tax=Sinobacterium caligoides TaxID=933926 RepID=A0A3N2DY72_9GAMM|nr:succinate dehydrogenase, hydrophobic membrane anchor protein [Sinobacterium caligoides]ROS04791.1 succinate dehydrogenase / fumarate reductase membrane anchor subunit [Sinobacterium caligoides]
MSVTSVTTYGRNGLADWLVQRVTAVVLLAYFVFLTVFIACNEITFALWSALFAETWMRVFSMMALLSLCAHAWIGLWGVSTDYMTARMMGAKGNLVRWVFQSVVAVVTFTYLVWGVQILWSVS